VDGPVISAKIFYFRRRNWKNYSKIQTSIWFICW